MPDNNSMRAAIAEALLPADEGTGEEPEATTSEAADTPSAQEGETQDTPDSEGTADQAETPTEYFGVDLSGLSDEERAGIIAGFQERDKFIQQLLRNKAEEPAAAVETTEDEVVTDDMLLKALGLDVEDDPYAEHTAKVALPLAKLVLNLQEEVTGLKTRTELDATERYWTKSLTDLEAKFGPLPASHEEVMRLAAEAGVAEPVDAYWRIMGPARQQVLTEVQKRRDAVARTLKEGAKGNVRPKDEAEGSEKVIDAKDVKDAMKQSITSLFRERGITLDENE